jgi:glycosyltransferase involved in cell wall biosynthesis
VRADRALALAADQDQGVSAPLSVVVDGRELTGDSAGSGIGTYIRNLLAGLAAFDDIAVEALATRDAVLPAGVRRVPIRRVFYGRRRAVIEHASLVAVDLALRSRADVFHNPLFHAPAGIRRRWVQTLHDVIPLVDPDPALDVLRRRWRRFGPRYRSADAVVADSRHTADEGIRLLGLRADRVHVVHLGVSSAFSPDGPRFEADPPYVLAVGQFSARKGVGEALAVIDRIADAGLPHRLRLAGWVPPSLQAAHDDLLARAPRPDRVEVLGFVDDLAALYRGASLVLVPSRYEGFGLPALEAMASGVPVVSFANSSLPEVVGDGGVLVPDGDVLALADAAIALLANEGRAGEVAAAGLARARTFTWDRCARQTADVYREIADR